VRKAATSCAKTRRPSSPAGLDFEKNDSKIVKWVKRFRHLGERIFILCPSRKDDALQVATFGDFASNIMPQVKWLEEFTALRRLEKSFELTNSPAKVRAE
jgi:hypothetical protein